MQRYRITRAMAGEAEEKKKRIRDKLLRELGPTVVAALADPLVVEVMLNPDGRLWIDKLGEGMSVVGEMEPMTAEALMATIATSIDTVITREKPIVEAELPTDGSRFEGVIPPVVERPTFTIRKKASKVYTLENYVAAGIMTAAQRERILRAVANRENVLIAGGTGTGKTTFANAVLQAIGQLASEHRIVTIEDTRELQCPVENLVSLRTTDSVDMQKLLKTTMRLRPDRIVVGEVRDRTALDLLKAWNTGHPGGVGTVHANNAAAALVRIAQLVEEGLEGAQANREVIAEAINLIVVIEKMNEAPRRRVTEILEIKGFSDGGYVFGDRLLW